MLLDLLTDLQAIYRSPLAFPIVVAAIWRWRNWKVSVPLYFTAFVSGFVLSRFYYIGGNAKVQWMTSPGELASTVASYLGSSTPFDVLSHFSEEALRAATIPYRASTFAVVAFLSMICVPDRVDWKAPVWRLWAALAVILSFRTVTPFYLAFVMRPMDFEQVLSSSSAASRIVEQIAIVPVVMLATSMTLCVALGALGSYMARATKVKPLLRTLVSLAVSISLLATGYVCLNGLSIGAGALWIAYALACVPVLVAFVRADKVDKESLVELFRIGTRRLLRQGDRGTTSGS